MSRTESALRSAFQRRIDAVLVVLGVIAVIFVVSLLSSNLIAQYQNYRSGIDKVLAGAEINYGALLTFSRAWDFALIKTSGLFLGFLLIFVGTLYVLRTAESTFSASVDTPGGKGKLESSSPGLVLTGLGVVLVVVVILKQSSLAYSPLQAAVQPVDGAPVDAVNLDAPTHGRVGEKQ